MSELVSGSVGTPSQEGSPEMEALAEIARLHSGLHICMGGQWWGASESYRGSIANREPCPTAALAAVVVSSPATPPDEWTPEPHVTIPELPGSSPEEAACAACDGSCGPCPYWKADADYPRKIRDAAMCMSDEVVAEHRGYNIAPVDLAAISMQLDEGPRPAPSPASPAETGEREVALRVLLALSEQSTDGRLRDAIAFVRSALWDDIEDRP